MLITSKTIPLTYIYVDEYKSLTRNVRSILYLVLEMYGHFSGINRKVQMKYQPNGKPKGSSSDEESKNSDPSLVLILKWGK